MRLTWLGHSGFRIEIAGQTILLDPWLSGNPMFPEDRRGEAIAGASHVLITHGHFDHIADAVAISRELGIPCVGIYDLMSWWEEKEGIEVIGFNKGGTVHLGEVAVTMVNATHSASMSGPNGPVYTGTESGYMIAAEGHVIYVSGDTDVMADMEVFNDLHAPDIGVLCAGGHFTMDMKRAAYAARTYFDFKTIVPCHYRTFPIVEQSAEILKNELPEVDVIEPEVLVPIEI
jgi:L-ascorbate metabolism protein UlaG (beta-lactamase superfamily)